jgi:hypothetical protein
MSRLSDAFFIPSQEDIELIKAALRRSGVSDDDIKKIVGITTSAGSVNVFPCQRNWNESSIEL